MGKQGTPPPTEKSAVTDATTYEIPGATAALSGSTGPNERMNKMTTSLGFGDNKGGMKTMEPLNMSKSVVKKPLEKSSKSVVKKPLEKSVKKSNTEIISDKLLQETEDRTGTGSIYDESTWTI